MSTPSSRTGEICGGPGEGSPASTRPPALVLDTNVVLDWLAFDDPTTRPLGEAITQGKVRWLRSEAMADELARVLNYPALQARAIDAAAVLARAETHSQLVPAGAPAPLALRCADPDDQGFIDLALVHPGTQLLSRDKAVLALKRPALARGLPILSPAQWLAQHSQPVP